jgi:uncharacterized protein YndB with AHSA1/START domain
MSGPPIPGDQARVSVLVAARPAEAFRVFTEEINEWWRTGLRFRIAGKNRSVIGIEPRLGGRMFEAIEEPAGTRVVETGRVLAWEPPGRLLLEWRAVNFAPSETTEVEVTFEPQTRGTLVTLTHRGWAAIRPDHPVRHGQEVPAFIRMLAMFWGDLMTSMRERLNARTP